MADNTIHNENTSDQDTGQGDSFKNLKEEFNRKLSNQSEELKSLKATNEQLIQQLQYLAANSQQAKTLSTPAESSTEKGLGDLLYEDPEAYAKEIEKRAEERAMKRVSQSQDKERQRQSTLSELAAAYPELQSVDHNLSKRAVEIFSGFSERDKDDPKSYKLAVYQAANELGLPPASMRTSNNYSSEDAFTMSSNNRSPRPSKKRQKEMDEGKLTEIGKMFAQYLGYNPDDARYKEHFEDAALRKNWTAYKSTKISNKDMA